MAKKEPQENILAVLGIYQRTNISKWIKIVYFIYHMNFEFDEQKSRSNKTKHGIDFIEAQKLWHDENALEIPAKTIDEPRFLVIAKIEDTIWSAIITYRGNNIRIISVRRSRKEEIKYYES